MSLMFALAVAPAFHSIFGDRRIDIKRQPSNETDWERTGCYMRTMVGQYETTVCSVMTGFVTWPINQYKERKEIVLWCTTYATAGGSWGKKGDAP